MNKREQQEFQKAKDDAEMYRALSWPTLLKPSPLTYEEVRRLCGESADRHVRGWFINSHSGTFSQGVSNGINHSFYRTDKTTTQGCGKFYRTKEEAILALRWEMCIKFAKELAVLDARITQ